VFNISGSKEGRKLFESRLSEILAHNNDASTSYKLGVNMFTDQPQPPKGRSAAPHAPKARGQLDQSILEKLNTPVGELPTSVDWRDAGVISPVKNQGNCGSCWAFATTETVESHVALSTGLLYSLSPQQLVACAPNDQHCGGVGGCMG
jgi:cathepsin L